MLILKKRLWDLSIVFVFQLPRTLGNTHSEVFFLHYEGADDEGAQRSSESPQYKDSFLGEQGKSSILYSRDSLPCITQDE